MKKKISFAILSVFISLTAFSQHYGNLRDVRYEDDFSELKNEIHVNLLTSVFGLPEINYERFLESNFSLGLSVMASLDEPNDQELRALFVPFGRLYFGDENCAGFYIEGNTAIIIEKYRNYNFYYSSSSSPTYEITQSTTSFNSYTNFGLGVAIGYKFLTRNNWVGDIFGGAGRVFGDTRIETYPRFGISIGKRF